MNLRERLQLRAAINLILNVLERLIKILSSIKTDTPKVDNTKSKTRKKILDIVLPWRNKK